jgi:uncharacterized protein YceK
MKRVSILAFVLISALLSGCNAKSKSNDQNATPQRSEAAKAMDSDLLPEGGGKKLPMF